MLWFYPTPGAATYLVPATSKGEDCLCIVNTLLLPRGVSRSGTAVRAPACIIPGSIYHRKCQEEGIIPKFCSVGYVQERNGGEIYPRVTRTRHFCRLCMTSIPVSRHLCEFSTTYLPVPGTSVRSVRNSYQYGVRVTTSYARVRYFCAFCTTSIPSPILPCIL